MLLAEVDVLAFPVATSSNLAAATSSERIGVCALIQFPVDAVSAQLCKRGSGSIPAVS